MDSIESTTLVRVQRLYMPKEDKKARTLTAALSTLLHHLSPLRFTNGEKYIHM
jgi:hypothetical protein